MDIISNTAMVTEYYILTNNVIIIDDNIILQPTPGIYLIIHNSTVKNASK